MLVVFQCKTTRRSQTMSEPSYEDKMNSEDLTDYENEDEEDCDE